MTSEEATSAGLLLSLRGEEASSDPPPSAKYTTLDSSSTAAASTWTSTSPTNSAAGTISSLSSSSPSGPTENDFDEDDKAPDNAPDTAPDNAPEPTARTTTMAMTILPAALLLNNLTNEKDEVEFLLMLPTMLTTTTTTTTTKTTTPMTVLPAKRMQKKYNLNQTLKDLGFSKFDNDSNNTTALAEHIASLGLEEYSHVGDDALSKQIFLEHTAEVANENIAIADFKQNCPKKGTNDVYLKSEDRQKPLHGEVKAGSFRQSSKDMDVMFTFSGTDHPHYFYGFVLFRSADPFVDKQTLEYFKTNDIGNEAMWSRWEKTLGKMDINDEVDRRMFIKVLVVPYAEIDRVGTLLLRSKGMQELT